MARSLTATNARAAVVDAGGVQAVAVDEAMGKVRAALSSKSPTSRTLYGIVVYDRYDQTQLNLRTWNLVFSAYWKGWHTVEQLNITHPDEDHVKGLTKQDFGDVCFYWGREAAKDAKETVTGTPGVYLLPSHLDAESLGLPPFPEPFRGALLFVQVRQQSAATREKGGEWNPWEALARIGKADEPNNIERDSVQWRTKFMSENECWTSAKVAKESSSSARNKAAIASRWLSEKRIFSIPFEGRSWFPRFQFRYGRPIPAVATVISSFPDDASGWDLAYFFTTPNAFIGGRKPLVLLKQDPNRLQSLAKSFANPAHVF